VLAVKLGLGTRGIYAAIMIAYVTFAVAAAMLWRTGRWKKARV
jgi:hypothetical protein